MGGKLGGSSECMDDGLRAGSGGKCKLVWATCCVDCLSVVLSYASGHESA